MALAALQAGHLCFAFERFSESGWLRCVIGPTILHLPANVPVPSLPAAIVIHAVDLRSWS